MAGGPAGTGSARDLDLLPRRCMLQRSGSPQLSSLGASSFSLQIRYWLLATLSESLKVASNRQLIA
jgi:hypothetical protein